MPGPIVHVGSTVICMHGGTATPTAPFPRVLVSGQPIITQTSPYVVAGCGLTGTTVPPCVSGQFVVAATRVFAGGAPVVTQGSSQAVCAPTGTGLNVLVAQSRVIAT
jgi:hypothetical protein